MSGRLVWAATSTFRIGDLHLGVRSGHQGLHEWLRRALAAHLVPDVEAPDNFTLLVGQRGDGEASRPARGRAVGGGFHFLYRSSASMVRTRDPHRLARALLHHLDGFRPDAGAGLLQLSVSVLVGEAGAVLAPASLRGWLEVVERRLNARGLIVADLPWVAVDADRGEVVVPEPDLRVDWSAFDDLEEVVATPRRTEAVVQPGRYPIVGWGLQTEADGAGTLRPALAVARAAPSVINVAELGGQGVLDQVAGLVRRVRPAGVHWEKPAQMVGPLAALAS
ncbi:MAG: hypothetical protein ACRD0N_02025 [Acidimicrobiales bacterium]